jgi:hypothetical protein
MSPEAQIAQMPAAAAPASPTLSDAPLSTGVENYLLAHQRFSGVTGQVRAVADERRVPASPAPSGSAQ